jgi:predicted amidohydrolase YtcJ
MPLPFATCEVVMKVFQNGVFISCEENNRVFSHMVADKGRIVFAGDHLPEAYRRAQTIDLEGRCAVPAFGDTHMHFSSFAFFNAGLDTRTATDFGHLAELIRRHIDSHPREKVVLGFGCSAHTVKENRLPFRSDLDAITDRPLLLVKYDGHAAVGNSALMARLPKAILQEEGFEDDTGWFYSNAFYKATNHISRSVPLARFFRNLLAGTDYLARRGIALVHTSEGVGFPLDLDVDLVRLANRGLPITFHTFFQTMDVGKAARRGLPRIGGCFATALDGCFGSEDAALDAPYAHRPDSRGTLFYSAGQTNAFVLAAHRRGLQVALHAIGDAAIDQALNAIEAALKAVPRPDHRHIIIHADLMTPPMIEKAARLGVCIALQTPFLHWEQEPVAYLERILGSRIRHLIPLRSMLRHGIALAGGSDAPCTLPDPIAAIHAACNHPNPDESLTVLEALQLHTAWCAGLSYEENERGTLTAGKRADFVLLSQNPLAVPVQRLKEIAVEKVYLGGSLYEGLHDSALALLLDALRHRYPPLRAIP